MQTITPHAAAAKAIRQELKEAFPGVKFSVRSSSFSMGNGVNISWTDGPTTAQVEAITGKYEYGHFDGMTDMYENSNVRDDIPQAKYVFASRDYSREAYAAAIDRVNANFGWSLRISDRGPWVDEASNFHTGYNWASQEIHQDLRERAL